MNIINYNTFNWKLLPRDIQYKIISYLDIDSRRKINIYTKLKIPKEIKDKLNNRRLPIKILTPYCTNIVVSINKLLIFILIDNNDNIIKYNYCFFNLVDNTIILTSIYEYKDNIEYLYLYN